MNLNVEDPAALIAYLRRSRRIDNEAAPRVEVLAGGVSNRTVLVVRDSGTEADWVIKQALPKLRVEVDWYSDPERVHREALGLRWLERLLPDGSVPHFVFEDREHHLLAMEAVPRPHENWKSRLLLGRLDVGHVNQSAQMLAAIHRCSYDRREELAPLFEDRVYFESLRLEPYYAFTAAEVPEAANLLYALIDETRQSCWTLVHGDFSPKNILIHQDRLVLLDHEVIHWGDPGFDVGFSLTHLLSKAHHLRHHRSEFATAAQTFWRGYSAAIGDGLWQNVLEQRAVRHTLGCLLARVAGRSPLEYLGEDQRVRQQWVVIELINQMPQTINELVTRFIERLNSLASH